MAQPLSAQAPIVIRHAEAAEAVETWTPERLENLAWDTAERYGLNVRKFVETMRCESKYFTVSNGQSEVIQRDGTREPSWGVAQFYIPSGLETADGRQVTKEIAQNPREALDAAAYNFSIGNARHWTCYRNL